MSGDRFELRSADQVHEGDVIWVGTTTGPEPVTHLTVSALGGVIAMVTPGNGRGYQFAPDHQVMVRVPEREGALL